MHVNLFNTSSIARIHEIRGKYEFDNAMKYVDHWTIRWQGVKTNWRRAPEKKKAVAADKLTASQKGKLAAEIEGLATRINRLFKEQTAANKQFDQALHRRTD